MKTNRPRLKIPYQTMDIIIEIISITILILIVGYTAVEYFNLPETIPTHFNSKGEANDYGARITVWLIPAIALIMYTGLFILNKYPHLHNYMVNITDENALKNYRFSTRVLRIVNLFTMTILAIVALKIIETGKGNLFSIDSWFVPLIVGLSLILPIIILLYMRKINKE